MKWNPLNAITLVQSETDIVTQMITISKSPLTLY